MTTAWVRTSLTAIVGMLVGYALWLAMGVLVILTLPVHYWVIAGGTLLAAFTVLAFLAARRCTNPATATMVRWSPLLPMMVSLYLLALVLFWRPVALPAPWVAATLVPPSSR
jgi:uncharacterized membrane protein